MSTTVTYKGNTLATVSNNTKTLKTAGKYMEGDVVLTDVSQSASTIQSLSITPSETAQTFNALGVDGYKPVSVDAIPIISDYAVQIGDESFYTENNNRKYRVRPFVVSTETGYLKFTRYASKTGDYTIYNAVASDITITPTESSQTIGGARCIMEGPVTVGAISSTYVGSGITQRSSTDLTVSGATVTAPAGYYSAAASKSVTTKTLPASLSDGTSGTLAAAFDPSTSTKYLIINAGYYNTGYYKLNAMPSGSATAPSTISGTAASVSTGTNTLTLTKTVSVTPTVSAGYVSSGTAGNSSVSLTANVTINPTPTVSGATVTVPAGYYSTNTSKTIPTAEISKASVNYSWRDGQFTISNDVSTSGYINNNFSSNVLPDEISGITIITSKTITPTESIQVVADKGTFVVSDITVDAISSTYVGTGVTRKAAATITPSTTNQTIAAGTYLTGTQTIAGDADLVGSNILSTANIFGVQGTVDFIDVYIRSAAPTSSVGSDGDIYIQE